MHNTWGDLVIQGRHAYHWLYVRNLAMADSASVAFHLRLPRLCCNRRPNYSPLAKPSMSSISTGSLLINASSNRAWDSKVCCSHHPNEQMNKFLKRYYETQDIKLDE